MCRQAQRNELGQSLGELENDVVHDLEPGQQTQLLATLEPWRRASPKTAADEG